MVHRIATPPTAEAITITTVMPVDFGLLAAAPESESLEDDPVFVGAGTDTVWVTRVPDTLLTAMLWVGADVAAGAVVDGPVDVAVEDDDDEELEFVEEAEEELELEELEELELELALVVREEEELEELELEADEEAGVLALVVSEGLGVAPAAEPETEAGSLPTPWTGTGAVARFFTKRFRSSWFRRLTESNSVASTREEMATMAAR